jgi:hypothetical protein
VAHRLVSPQDYQLDDDDGEVTSGFSGEEQG